MKRKKQQPGAVALTYDSGKERAPRVAATGRGAMAEKIIQIAREHNIHIHNDPDLLEMLSQLDLNREIPACLYEVVAELLAFIYLLNSEESKK